MLPKSLTSLTLVVGAVSITLAVSAAPTASARAIVRNPDSRALSPSTLFSTPPPISGLPQEVATLNARGNHKDAALLTALAAVPQAVWLKGSTSSGAPQSPDEVRLQVSQIMAQAGAAGAVPVFVIDNIPGGYCAQSTTPHAQVDASYKAWFSAMATGIGGGRAVVLLDPSSLGLMPGDCLSSDHALDATNYPFTNAERVADITFAVSTLEAHPEVRVYLDATNSSWEPVGEAAQRLVEAGVQRAQGFFVNVSAYNYTQNEVQYGTWISACIAMGNDSLKFNYQAVCPNQYWNGGPDGTSIAALEGKVRACKKRALDGSCPWTGTPLSQYGVWSDTSPNPAFNTSGVNERYAKMVPTTHFVIDTSRNGLGPDQMDRWGKPPYNQPPSVVAGLRSGGSCNPPDAGLGARPTANTRVDLVDAYLWVATPGESDGQCGRTWDYSVYSGAGWPATATTRQGFDPLWGLDDPAAGTFFPQEALRLAENANPPLR